jgi:hypothetical protein
VLQLIDYHSARAIEELDRAQSTQADAERSSHMELCRLHLYQAGWLRAAQDGEAIGDRVD